VLELFTYNSIIILAQQYCSNHYEYDSDKGNDGVLELNNFTKIDAIRNAAPQIMNQNKFDLARNFTVKMHRPDYVLILFCHVTLTFIGTVCRVNIARL